MKRSSSRNRSSIIWKYCKKTDDPNEVLCTLCGKHVRSCGNTTNVMNHLTSNHKSVISSPKGIKRQNKEVIDLDSAVTPKRKKQATVSMRIENVCNLLNSVILWFNNHNLFAELFKGTSRC